MLKAFRDFRDFSQFSTIHSGLTLVWNEVERSVCSTRYTVSLIRHSSHQLTAQLIPSHASANFHRQNVLFKLSLAYWWWWWWSFCSPALPLLCVRSFSALYHPCLNTVGRQELLASGDRGRARNIYRRVLTALRWITLCQASTLRDDPQTGQQSKTSKYVLQGRSYQYFWGSSLLLLRLFSFTLHEKLHISSIQTIIYGKHLQ